MIPNKNSQMTKILSLLLLLNCAWLLPRLPAQTGPVKVELRQEGDRWQLYRDGQPYFVKGAGGKTHLDKVVECGGNTIRTWSADGAGEILDAAYERGINVCLGLWVGHERHGFDYDDSYAVAGQLAKFSAIVDQYKDHPALAFWAVGNEMDLFYKNFKVWKAVEDIAKMIKDKDPNHPTMTVTAGIDVSEVQMIKAQCPSIDILGINTYADIDQVPDQIRQYGWDGPYMITEWGPTGHWQSPNYAWGAPREQTGAEKAKVYHDRYKDFIATDTQLCLGSFVFLWGQKQEKTATWYGLFLKTGEPTEAVDVLQKVWTGKWPDNRAPHVEGMEINGQGHREDIYLQPGKTYTALLQASDPDGETMTVKWEVAPESREKKAGGDFEAPLAAMEDLVQQVKGMEMTFAAPNEPGPYRLYAIAKDAGGKVGTINVPFYVKK